jgi:hypothetical protein
LKLFDRSLKANAVWFPEIIMPLLRFSIPRDHHACARQQKSEMENGRISPAVANYSFNRAVAFEAKVKKMVLKQTSPCHPPTRR